MKNNKKKSSLKSSLRKGNSKGSLKSGDKAPGIEYSAAPKKPSICSQCWFWCVFPCFSIIMVWGLAIANNEGCPEYTIIEEL